MGGGLQESPATAPLPNLQEILPEIQQEPGTKRHDIEPASPPPSPPPSETRHQVMDPGLRKCSNAAAADCGRASLSRPKDTLPALHTGFGTGAVWPAPGVAPSIPPSLSELDLSSPVTNRTRHNMRKSASSESPFNQVVSTAQRHCLHGELGT